MDDYISGRKLIHTYEPVSQIVIVRAHFRGNVESCRQLKSVDWALLNRRHLKPLKTTTAKP